MKVTKLTHACLLVEMPEPVNRTVLFDPGEMSRPAVEAARLQYLDDIIITHEHFDHFNPELVQSLVKTFPEVRILAPPAVVSQLAGQGISASATPAEDLVTFAAPHEELEPLGKTPEAIGVHYLDQLTHPGDSHHFDETKAILALPVTAPWGSTTAAARLAVRLKPRFVIPIHDWMWRQEWRDQFYGGMAEFFESQGIIFINAIDNQAVVIDLERGTVTSAKDNA